MNDAVSIEQLRSVLFSGGSLPTRESLQRAVEVIKYDPRIADELLDTFFPNGVPETKEFYDLFWKITEKLEFTETTSTIGGLLWSRALERFSEKNRSKSLEALSGEGVAGFFEALDALPTLLSHTDLPAEFLSKWLLSLRRRIGRDMADLGFLNGLKTLSENFPEKSLRIIDLLQYDLSDEYKIQIAAHLLAWLQLHNADLTGLRELSDGLLSHIDVLHRTVYHRAWTIIARERPLSDQEVVDLVGRMSNGNKEEVMEALCLLAAILSQDSTSDPTFLFGLRWIHEKSSNTSPDIWKHLVVVLANELYQKWIRIGKSSGIHPITELIIKIVPISVKAQDTWHQIERILLFLLENDSDEFKRFMFGLVKAEAGTLTSQFRSQQKFCLLKNAMRFRDLKALVFEALLSDEGKLRQLGFSLFQSLALTSLDDTDLAAVSDKRVAILIYAFRQELIIDGGVARFLLALEPRIKSGSKALQELFIEEVIFQCKNLPGGCFEPIKIAAATSELIGNAVAEVSNYFEELRPCLNSEINSMGIPGIQRAARIKASRERKAIQAYVQKNSLVGMLATTSYTLYGGKSWQPYMDGQLNPISEMKEYGNSVEIPRIDIFDATGVAIRRHQAKKAIHELMNKEKGLS